MSFRDISPTSALIILIWYLYLCTGRLLTMETTASSEPETSHLIKTGMDLLLLESTRLVIISTVDVCNLNSLFTAASDSAFTTFDPTGGKCLQPLTSTGVHGVAIFNICPLKLVIERTLQSVGLSRLFSGKYRTLPRPKLPDIGTRVVTAPTPFLILDSTTRASKFLDVSWSSKD
eukprot:NODE_132_length_16614_cov_0.935392.p13 type:complete len:175 gc:universal NODE_132_length_16614_cov_0.935392:760-236(-)